MDEDPPSPPSIAVPAQERPARQEQDLLIREFVRHHGRHLVGIAARMVGRDSAEDVAQEAFVHLAKKIERCAPGTMDLLRSPVDLRKLMFRITACRAYEHLRRRTRERQVADDGAQIDHAIDEESLQRSERTRDVEVLDQAYQALPPMQRIAHVLHHYYGFTDAEIAMALEISKSNSRSLVCRATRALKGAMGTSQ